MIQEGKVKGVKRSSGSEVFWAMVGEWGHFQ